MSAARKKRQLSRHARGYTNAHVARRRQLEPLVATGQVNCCRCDATHPARPALASRPPRRPPRLPRPLTRNLQPPRRRREDERQEKRPSADLVTGLVRADPAKRHSQRQRRRRRNPHFLSLAPARYRAVSFLRPKGEIRWG